MQSYESFLEEWLNDITQENPTTVELGNRFSRKIVTQWLDFEDDPTNLIFCDGSGDGGIDVAYFYEGDGKEDDGVDGDTWYLIQSKYGKSFAGAGTLLTESQKVLDALTGKRTSLSSLSESLFEKLKNFISKASNKDKLILVFATTQPLSSDEKKTLEDIYNLAQTKLNVNFEVDAISVFTIYQRLLDSSPEFKKHDVQFVANLVPSGQDLLVGSAKLLNLYAFLKNYRDKTGDLDLLYEKNVRKFLGSRKKVNKGISDTLKEFPERFGLYNNGITIVVEDFQQSETDKFTLTEPYIVNGCQTTRTIWETLGNRLDSGGTAKNAEIEQWKEKLQKGIVVVKIVKVGAQGEALLTDTTRYTNSQNAVSQKDFIALEGNFKAWAREMGNKHNVFLEIQRGGWDSQKLYQRQSINTKVFNKWVNAFDLLKVIGAGWYNQPGLAFGKNPPFAPGGSMFKKIVDNPGFCVEDLYAAFLLHSVSEKIKFGRNASKPTRGQTRYLFYYVIKELLRDCMIHAQIPFENENITKCMILIFNDIESEASKVLIDASLNVIDDYLTKENEDSIFMEPGFNGDLNAFLKSDKLGKGSSEAPKLHSLITFGIRDLRRIKHEDISQRDFISQTIAIYDAFKR